MKRELFLWIAIALLGANLVVSVAACARSAGSAKIEYKVAVPGPEMGPKEIEDLLNQLGQEGWILVHAMPGLGLLLRR